MRKRNIRINIDLNEEENKNFTEKVKKSGLNKSDFFRKIMSDYQLKEKPDEKFYEVTNILRGMAVNLNQMARACNRYGYISEDRFIPLAHKIEDLVLSLQDVYIVPQKKVDK